MVAKRDRQAVKQVTTCQRQRHKLKISQKQLQERRNVLQKEIKISKEEQRNKKRQLDHAAGKWFDDLLEKTLY